jgi:hypothetical protein
MDSLVWKSFTVLILSLLQYLFSLCQAEPEMACSADPSASRETMILIGLQ